MLRLCVLVKYGGDKDRAIFILSSCLTMNRGIERGRVSPRPTKNCGRNVSGGYTFFHAGSAHALSEAA